MSLPLKGIVLSVALATLSGQLLADDYADGVAAFNNKDFAAAVNFFSKAIEQDQNNADAFVYRGGAYNSLGELDKAFADCDAAIRLDPKQVSALANRGSVWFAKNEFDKALADYDAAIRLDAQNATIYIGRGSTWYAKGEADKAIADYEMAIRLDPNDVSAYINRGAAWYAKGDLEKVLADFDSVVRLDPNNALFHIYRGDVLDLKGDFAQALAAYDAAIRLDPKSAMAYNNRAWLRATCQDDKFRDGAKAVEDAMKASELASGQDFSMLDTLAAAYAEAGQFDKAVEWQQKAIELAPDDQKEDLGTRLELYQAKKPNRVERK